MAADSRWMLEMHCIFMSRLSSSADQWAYFWADDVKEAEPNIQSHRGESIVVSAQQYWAAYKEGVKAATKLWRLRACATVDSQKVGTTEVSRLFLSITRLICALRAQKSNSSGLRRSLPHSAQSAHASSFYGLLYSRLSNHCTVEKAFIFSRGPYRKVAKHAQSIS